MVCTYTLLHIYGRMLRRRHGSDWLRALPAKEAIGMLQTRLRHVSGACDTYKQALDAAYQDHALFPEDTPTNAVEDGACHCIIFCAA